MLSSTLSNDGCLVTKRPSSFKTRLKCARTAASESSSLITTSKAPSFTSRRAVAVAAITS